MDGADARAASMTSPVRDHGHVNRYPVAFLMPFIEDIGEFAHFFMQLTVGNLDVIFFLTLNRMRFMAREYQVAVKQLYDTFIPHPQTTLVDRAPLRVHAYSNALSAS